MCPQQLQLKLRSNDANVTFFTSARTLLSDHNSTWPEVQRVFNLFHYYFTVNIILKVCIVIIIVVVVFIIIIIIINVIIIINENILNNY